MAATVDVECHTPTLTSLLFDLAVLSQVSPVGFLAASNWLISDAVTPVFRQILHREHLKRCPRCAVDQTTQPFSAPV